MKEELELKTFKPNQMKTLDRTFKALTIILSVSVGILLAVMLTSAIIAQCGREVGRVYMF